MWNRPFIIPLNTGNNVAVLVIDTQGTFDDNTKHADCASIFALSTLMSSLQVYNIMKTVNESDLQHLSLFAAYANSNHNHDKTTAPFQDLMFLMRDWPVRHSGKFPFGLSGGTRYTEKTLKVENRQGEHSELRRDLRRAFAKISGFNIPKPGDVVEENIGDNCNIEDLNEDFVVFLKEFLNEVFCERNIVLKTVNGHNMHSEHLFRRIREWAKCFTENTLAMEDIYHRTLRADDEMALEDAVRQFKKDLADFIANNKNWDTDTESLKDFFDKEKTEIPQHYFNAPGLGNLNERRQTKTDTLSVKMLNEFLPFLYIALKNNADKAANNSQQTTSSESKFTTVASSLAFSFGPTVANMVLPQLASVMFKTPPPPPTSWYRRFW